MELELTPKPVPGRSLYKNHLGEGIGERQVQGKENVSQPYLLQNCKSLLLVMHEYSPGHPKMWVSG